jgi:hypothetical protein
MPKAKPSSRKKRTSPSALPSRSKRRPGARIPSRPRHTELGKRRVKTRVAKTARSAAKAIAAKRARRASAVRKQSLAWASAQKLCPSCRSANPAAAVVCIQCGAKLAKTAAPAAGVSKKPVAEQPPRRPVESVRPAKSRLKAILLEILPAFLGVFGIGWIYAGNKSIGLLWLIGMLIWDVFGILAALFTGGMTLSITIPINLLMVVITFISLYNFMHRNPDAFGFY